MLSIVIEKPKNVKQNPVIVLPGHGAQRRNRTTDTRIFSPLLYRLSYLGDCGDAEGARTLDLQRDRLAF
jgi:hypothetical protein